MLCKYSLMNLHNVPKMLVHISRPSTDEVTETQGGQVTVSGHTARSGRPLTDYPRVAAALTIQTQEHPHPGHFHSTLPAFTMLPQTWLHLSMSSKWGSSMPVCYSVEKLQRFLQSYAGLGLELSPQQLVLASKSRWFTIKSVQNPKLAQTSLRPDFKK